MGHAVGRSRSIVTRRSFSKLLLFSLLAVGLLLPSVAGFAVEAATAAPHARVPQADPGNAVIPNSGFTDFADVEMPPTDDGSWPVTGAPEPYPFGFDVNFYGTQYSGAYVNANGNITFGGPLSTYTPFGLASAGAVIIAPFFADVDTNAGNTINIGTGELDGNKVFVVNWPGVGCYDTDSVTDNFQVVLIDRPDLGTGVNGDDYQIEFNYDSIQWDAGQASGGNASCTGAPSEDSATVGYSNGTSTPGDSFQLAGSQDSGAFLDTNTTTGLIYNDLNSDVPGRYVFTIENGQPPAPTSIDTSLSGGGQSGSSISVPPGTDVTDSATLSGANAATAGGTVTYTVYSDDACTVPAASGGTVDVSAGSVPASNPVTLSSVGTYYWQAAYSGDALDNASTSSCSEVENVVRSGTSTSTAVFDASSGTPWAGTEVTGASAYDTAAVGLGDLEAVRRGTDPRLRPETYAGPTGSVTYSFYDNGTCSGDAATTDTEDLSDGAVPNSATTAALAAGSYSFAAAYSGDANYSASTSSCEPFSVAQASPPTGTVVDDATSNTPWGGDEATGATAYDTSSVDGVEGFTPTGSVTYSFYDNGTCSGDAATTDTEDLSDGAVPNSATTAALAAGSYSFAAAYSGDANYSASTSSCEPFSVAQASPPTGTVVDDATSNTPWGGDEATGATAYDTSSVDGVEGFTPTGSVTYSFYDNGTCSGDAATTDTEDLSDGAVPNSATTAALAAGSYSFAAAYSGDANYSASTSSCEPFSVAQASPPTGTVVDDATSNTPWGGDEATGATAYDTSSVDGVEGFTPTGSVTYSFYDNGTCSGDAATTDTEDLSDGAVPNSATTAALAAGSYSFAAAYSGDANYSASTSSCEPFSVAQASRSISTVVDDASRSETWNGTEVTGATAYDTAAVTAGPSPDLAPTGTVTYSFYDNNTCAGSPATTQTVTLSGGAVPNSDATEPLAAGSYGYEAAYSGDGNYLGASGECEPFAVAPSPASAATVVDDASSGSAWNGTEVTGASALDTATVSSIEGFTPTGTVTYSFYDNNTCTGSPATTQTVTLSGGAVPNSDATEPLAAGSYAYQAAWSGDSNYASASGECEPFAVAPSPASAATVVDDASSASAWNGTEVTGASALDTATVSSIEGFTPTGTVTYSFYDNNTCTGSPATTQTVTLSGGAVPNSDPTGPLATGSYGYQAAWSGDSNYASAIGECEGFSVLEAATATSTIVYDAALGAPWSGTETTGASAYDTATVTAPAAPLTDVGRRRHLAPRATGIAATGQVTYDFFENATCNGEAFSTATVTLAAGAAPDSSATAPLGAGSYSFQATYAGDANYHPSTSGCEPFSVGPVLTATSTIVYDTSHGVPWNGTEATGASAYDTATVVGVPGFVPTGTVTYDFFANGTCGLPASTTDAVTLSDGTVPNSSATSPLGADGYSFDATYSGDVNDLPETSSCEAFSVAKAASSTRSAVYDAATRKVWSGTEDQGAAAYDRATVTGVAGFAPAGTLTYRLFPNSFCSGTVSSFQTVTVAGGHVPASAVTGSLPPARYSYRATYSGSNEYDASTGTCESFRTLAVGYRVEGGDGGVFDFHVPFYGSVPGLGYRDLFNFVGMADSSKGYWLVESNGGIFHFGNAHSYGSLPQRGKTVDNIVGMAATPNGRGYWMVASDGTVYRFGNAAAHGSLSSRGIHVNDIVAIESPDAGGYWLVGANGTVYGFGDAHYRGSCLQANSGCKGISDIVGIADAGSSGYWLVSQNGRVFSFGAVKSHGSCGQAASGCAGAHNVIGIASPDVGGYWLAEANGKVIGFGDAKLFGDEVGKGLTRPLVAIA